MSRWNERVSTRSMTCCDYLQWFVCVRKRPFYVCAVMVVVRLAKGCDNDLVSCQEPSRRIEHFGSGTIPGTGLYVPPTQSVLENNAAHPVAVFSVLFRTMSIPRTTQRQPSLVRGCPQGKKWTCHFYTKFGKRHKSNWKQKCREQDDV